MEKQQNSKELSWDQKFFMSKKVTVIDKYNFYEYLSVMLD
jgi:hypothetical protein